MRPWSPGDGGLVLTVRLTPKGGRDAVDGCEATADGRSVLKVRVRAAAQDGEANAALIGLLARLLRIAPRDVTLAAGASARVKRLRLAGEPAALAEALERIVRA